MSDNEILYSPVYGCTIFDAEYEDDDRKVIDYEVLSSLSKSLKIKQLKLLHKHIIDVADELYRFSDSLGMNNKEELGIQKAILEALQNLNHVTEYLSKYTLSGE